ncbi:MULTISPECIES: BON domain-containing protein [Thermomonospora]|uniref:Osmotically-inducible protein OsmY n=1 Tax=Thermomonospora cellulosilytica TaxID=1411118 RepID=A0A7W3R7W8_9ACTN|nr:MULTISPECIES: BON domain-containing protein [Thermomonospora]MBA9003107.1 osmotically-inducible protein OsmY [Thermomonospora cellulosilytica]
MTRTEDVPHYLVEHIRDRVAEQAHELGIQVDVRGDKVYLRGQVMSEERRRDIEEAARAAAHGHTVCNEVSVVSSREPDGEEHLS